MSFTNAIENEVQHFHQNDKIEKVSDGATLDQNGQVASAEYSPTLIGQPKVISTFSLANLRFIAYLDDFKSHQSLPVGHIYEI